MGIIFEKMSKEHQKGVMSIYNYYVENSTAAFPAHAVPEEFYGRLLQMTEGHPAYVLIDDEKENAIVGFCMLSSLFMFSTFAKTACLTYFISPDYTGKGLGGKCLAYLEQEAKQNGIKTLIAEISTENAGSIGFHKKNGFEVVGELKNVGEKLGRQFGIVYMQKNLCE